MENYEVEFKRKQRELANLLLNYAEKVDEETIIINGINFKFDNQLEDGGYSLLFRDQDGRLAGIINLMLGVSRYYAAEYTGILWAVTNSPAGESTFRNRPSRSHNYGFYFKDNKWCIGTVPSDTMNIFGIPLNENPLNVMVRKYRERYGLTDIFNAQNRRQDFVRNDKQEELADLLLSCAERVDDTTIIIDSLMLNVIDEGAVISFIDKEAGKTLGSIWLMIGTSPSYDGEYIGLVESAHFSEAAESSYKIDGRQTGSCTYNFYFRSGEWCIGTIPSNTRDIFGGKLNENPLMFMVKEYKYLGGC